VPARPWRGASGSAVLRAGVGSRRGRLEALTRRKPWPGPRAHGSGRDQGEGEPGWPRLQDGPVANRTSRMVPCFARFPSRWWRLVNDLAHDLITGLSQIADRP